MPRKELLRELVRSGAIKSVDDINALVKDIYKETLETMLEAELDEELGYSRYDYRNKDTKNSRINAVAIRTADTSPTATAMASAVSECVAQPVN